RMRPGIDVEAVCSKERDGQAIQAKRGAGGVGDSAIISAEPPRAAEMILMVVEAHASGRRFLGVDRDEELELECLLNLIGGHALASAAKEGIAGGAEIEGYTELIGHLFGFRFPAFAER